MKEAYYINYEYQVLIPLILLCEERGLDSKITQFEMIDYRIKTAQEFAYCNIRVNYEIGLDAVNKFKKNFKEYINVDSNGDQVVYGLKPEVNLEQLKNVLYSSLPHEILEILIRKEILDNCFKESRALS